MPAEAVTWDSLHLAPSKVLDIADHVGPLLTTVHGGRTAIKLLPHLGD